MTFLPKQPEDVRFLCLCPIYNHPQRLLENSIQCFLEQTHRNALLLIVDDRDEGGYTEIIEQPDADRYGWVIVPRHPRYPNLGAKYQAMLEYGIQADTFDAVAVWEDDDIYFPDHLATHAEHLMTKPWVYYDQACSTYGGQFRLEPSGGRFWAGITMRLEALRVVGGFVDTARGTFDQEFIQRMTEAFPNYGRAHPTYCYRWGDTRANHTSALMGHADWYDRTPFERVTSNEIKPKFDQVTARLMQKWHAHKLEWQHDETY